MALREDSVPHPHHQLLNTSEVSAMQSESSVVISRPALRYHGGKWRIGNWIISHFPEHRVYVEPFGGAMSVLLRKPRCYAEVYTELYGEVVNLFRVLRDPELSTRLHELLHATPYARAEFLASYEPTSDPLEQARRTVVRSAMGVGTTAISRHATSFRPNTKRRGTIPAHDWAGYPAVLSAITERLQGVVIENRPAIDVMRSHDSAETLHYVDPPYPHSTRGEGQSENYRFEMSDDDHRELAGVVHSLEGMVIISGYDCPLYSEELYPDWECRWRPAFADGARSRIECLWLSTSVSDLLHR
jgi:DNA adenine methylase